MYYFFIRKHNRKEYARNGRNYIFTIFVIVGSLPVEAGNGVWYDKVR